MIRAGIDNRWIRFRCSKFHGAEHDLDSLVDHLYDDMESKVEASLTMFWMSLDIERLGAMASHESALGAFARVLREEGRKNFHLRSNAVSTFWIFSHFHNFHQLLIENQIGRATLILLDLESMRMQKQPAVTDLKALGSNVAKGEKILSLGLNENEPALEEQERFLYMSISLLYHIAEDPQIERRMCKYNLVEHLCEVLNRANACLLTIAMAFLKRLSLYIENLNPMRENGIMLKLSNFLHTENESLLSDTLQILHNLSFDRRFREDMVDSGFLQSFRSLLQKRKFEDMVTNILYNLSRDFDLRLRFAESELLSIVMEPLITENNTSVSEELGALIINLTYNPKVAMLNLKALEMEKFVSFVLGNNSLLLYKAMKNMSYIKGAGRLLQPYVPAFVVCLLRCEPSIQVELMEILNNLACLDEPWNDFMLNTNLLNYLSTHLQVSNNEDDIILQLIIFIGQICSETSAPVLSQSGLVKNLCDVFLDRTNDIDIALQSLYAIYCFLLHDPTRESFFQHFEKMVYHIVKLSQDFEKGVWTMAEFVLDAICELEESKGNFIKSLRFNTYNTNWEGTF